MTTIHRQYLTDLRNRQRAALQRYGLIAEEPDAEPISLADAYAHCRIDTFIEGSPPAAVSADDPWLEDVGIPAARAYCEARLGRALAPRTVRLVSSAFPSVTVDSAAGAAIALPFGPVQEVTAITYLSQDAYQAAYDAAYQSAYDTEFGSSGNEEAADAAGIAAGEIAGDAALTVTLATTAYTLDADSTPARILLAYGESWPTGLRTAANAVTVEYVAGYSIADDSPQAIPLPRLARAAMLEMLAHLYAHRGDESVDVSPAVDRLLALVAGRENLGFA